MIGPVRAIGSAALCAFIVIATDAPTYGEWTWTTLDYPGRTISSVAGVSGNRIIGHTRATNGFGDGFLYDGTTWTTANYPGAIGTYFQGISGSTIVGYYRDFSGYRGFYYDGATWMLFEQPGLPEDVDGDRTVGNYTDKSKHGFLYDGATWTILDYPGAIGTEVWGISGNNIVGMYYGSDTVAHGFLYDGNIWTTLDYPASRTTSCLGVDGDNIVGFYSDNETMHGFLYDGMTWTTLDYPGAGATYARSISGNNIVGMYDHAHGFLLTIPEPTALLLLALGGLAVMRRHVRRYGSMVIPAVAAALFLSAVSARAVNIETVPVGDPGNTPDMRYAAPGPPYYGNGTGYGAVGYRYSIGRYEVTAGQYTEFLNAVASVDTYALYNPEMAMMGGCGIGQSGGGTVGNPYTYFVESEYANHPVISVNYWNACRFANWLHNGQPSGPQNASTTEDGSYTLNGYKDDDGRWIQRNPGARWVVPSEDEWYKAAYHKGGSTNAGYWDYPTGSNGINTNMANYDSPSGATTDVGSYAYPGPYGTFDQGGNPEEWNEAIFVGYARGLRGGSFCQPDYFLSASKRRASTPHIAVNDVGFRVAYVPEPGSLLLLALSGLAVMRRR